MPRYVVHIYAVVRVPIRGKCRVTRESGKESDEITDLHKILDKGEVEYAEDIIEYLVDQIESNGDIKRSFWLDRDGNLVKQ